MRRLGCQYKIAKRNITLLQKYFDPAVVDSLEFKSNNFRNNNDNKEIFSMVYSFLHNQMLPPPNITGNIHIGHALTLTIQVFISKIQDFFARYYLMRNRNVKWQSGLDHAGIATQSKVLSELERKGVKIENLSRDEILEEVQG